MSIFVISTQLVLIFHLKQTCSRNDLIKVFVSFITIFVHTFYNFRLHKKIAVRNFFLQFKNCITTLLQVRVRSKTKIFCFSFIILLEPKKNMVLPDYMYFCFKRRILINLFLKLYPYLLLKVTTSYFKSTNSRTYLSCIMMSGTSVSQINK